ncbi:MAG: hypothetical protein M0P01_00575 [Treponema sp.]|nr:hypothetical protein [Treponema sp.]
MNEIITIKTSTKYLSKKKLEINPKILELLKNGEEGNLMIILPKGKSIDDLEVNRNGTLSTRIKDQSGKIINQASLIKKSDSLSVILTYVIQFTSNVYDIVTEMKNYLDDINDSEMEQCCDFINKVSQKIKKIEKNEALQIAYLTELIRKKEFIDQNIKLIRKKIEKRINDISTQNYNENFAEIEKLAEYLDFCIELYTNYVFLETAIQGNDIYDDMNEIKSEVNLVYKQNNDRLLPLLADFEQIAKSIADSKIFNSQMQILNSQFQGWYNPFQASSYYSNECSQANYIRSKKMRPITEVDFEKVRSAINIMDNVEKRYLIENEEIYEIEA